MADNIKQFQTPELGLRPSETGVEARAAAGRRLGAFYNQVAESTQRTGSTFGRDLGGAIRDAGDAAVNYISHQEISHGATEFAKLHAALTDAWNQRVKTADPNDISIAGEFNEKTLEPALQKFREAFNTDPGQKWAESHIDSLRQHLFSKTAADMSTLAGDAVVTNVRQMTNTWSNTARMDPSATDYLLKHAESSIDGVVQSSPNLKGVAAAKLRNEVLQKTKEDIVKAGALGIIERAADPETAATQVAKRWPDYINAQEIDQLSKSARYYKRINDSETRSNQVHADAAAKRDFNAKINELEIATMPQNVGDPPQLPPDYWQKLRELGTHPGAAQEPGRLKTMVTNGEAIAARLAKPEPLGRVSHDTTMQLLGRMRATDESRLTDNSPIYDAYQGGKLTNADFNFLNREFANLRTPEGEALGRDRSEFFKRYASIVDGAMNQAGIHSLLGTQRTYEFEMDARRQEADLRKKGLDPHLIYDPRSEYFFGRPENFAKYRVSLQEAQAYEATLKKMDEAAAKGGPAPKGSNLGNIIGIEVIDIPPGMSPAEAIKKFGGKKVRLPDGRTMTAPVAP